MIYICDLLYLVCILWFNAGVVRYNGILNSTGLLMLFVLASFICVLSRRYIRISIIKNSGILIGVLFFLLIIVGSITKYGGLESEASEILYAIIILVIALYLRTRPYKIRKVFLTVLMIDCILINGNTTYLLSSNADIARIFASGSDAVLNVGYSSFLLGGYGYIYTLVFSVIYIFCRLEKFKKSSRWYRLLIFVYMLTSIIVVIRASYTIGIIFMILGCTLAILTRNGVKVTTVILATSICLVGAFLLEELIPIIISSGVLGDMVSNRLSEIMLALNGNIASTNDLALRLELYTKTIKEIPSHFLFGVYESGINGRLNLGMHTEWLDRLALFGIVRYGVFVNFLVKSVKYSCSGIGEHLFAVFFCFILIGIINPIITKDVFLLFFIFIPFLFENGSEEMTFEYESTTC